MRFRLLPVLFCLAFSVQGCSTLYRNSMAKVDSTDEQRFGTGANEYIRDNGYSAQYPKAHDEGGPAERPLLLRSSAVSRQSYPSAEKTRSVAMGMQMHHVRNLWGLPDKVQVAGDGARLQNRHERWVYYPTLYEPVTRVVYFQGGRVTGWERQ